MYPANLDADNSDDEHEHHGQSYAPPLQPSYATEQEVSESDRESIASAREEYEEAYENAASSSASSSDQEELEEAREEYHEELEEAYDDDY